MFDKYSPKNQCLIVSQRPNIPIDDLDVRTFKEWKGAGMKVRKGEKAIKIWIPRSGKRALTEADVKTDDGEERTYWVLRGVLFDSTQVEPAKANTANQERRRDATMRAAAAEAEYDVYCNNTAHMDNPPSFTEWQEVQRLAAIAWDESLNAYDTAIPTVAY